MLRPYVRRVQSVRKDYNFVNMVRHDDPFVQFHTREMARDRMPSCRSNQSRMAQLHACAHNIAKQTQALSRADGYVIYACLRIVIVLQSNRASMMAVWVDPVDHA